MKPRPSNCTVRIPGQITPLRSCEKSIHLFLPGLERGVDGTTKESRSQPPQLRDFTTGDGVAPVARLYFQRIVGEIDGLAPKVQEQDGPVQVSDGCINQCRGLARVLKLLRLLRRHEAKEVGGAAGL